MMQKKHIPCALHCIGLLLRRYRVVRRKRPGVTMCEQRGLLHCCAFHFIVIIIVIIAIIVIIIAIIIMIIKWGDNVWTEGLLHCCAFHFIVIITHQSSSKWSNGLNMSIVQNSPSVALRNRWMRKHRLRFFLRHQMCTNCHAKQAWTIFNMISFRCVQYHQGWSVRSQAVLMALGVLTTSTGCPTNCSRLLSQLFLFSLA